MSTITTETPQSSTQIIASKLEAFSQKISLFNKGAVLLAVSKKQSPARLREAFIAGQRRFGENYLQEALPKIKALQDLSIEWHFIGPIQSNKCKAIAENFDWVHSLDRIKVAKKLNEHSSKGKRLQICIQVNIDREQNKSGVFVEELALLCQQVSSLSNLNLRGLMLIPKATESISEQRQSFAKLYVLFKQLQAQYPSIDTLSMGMSKDYQTALEEGSTMIRIGTGIFGERV